MTSYDDTKVQLTINRMTGECYENVPNKSSTELYLISQDPTSIAKIDLDAQSRTDAEISSIQSDMNALQSDLNDLSTEVSTLSEWTTTQIDDLIGDVQEVSSQTAQNAQDIADMSTSIDDISANLTHSTVRRWEYVEYNGLTFTAEEANSTVAMQKVGSAPDVSLEYSTGDGWNDFIVGETTVTLPNVGDKCVIRAKTTNSAMATSWDNYNMFVMTGEIAASDSIMYLLKNAGDLDTISTSRTFNNLFRGCSSLTTSPELPATTLAPYCYWSMFQNCTSLTTAPELPATTLADWCYGYMFQGCTSLTTAPELPATTLVSSCYSDMFEGCTSLTTAPELPATTLAYGCYAFMFNGCSSLTTPPELPATTLAALCYSWMFGGCASLTTAPDLAATTLAQSCYDNMFNGCTSLTSSPELPATTLTQQCYYGMFNGCSSLNEIKIAYTGDFSGDDVPTDAFKNWVNGVSANGTFYYDGSDTTTGASAIPTGWEVRGNTWPGLTFTAEEANSTVAMRAVGAAPSVSLEYSTDGGSTWNIFTVGSTTVTLANIGDEVCFRAGSGGNTTFATSNKNYNRFVTTGSLDVKGNIMSLLDQTLSSTTISTSDTFAYLFQDNKHIVDASELELPATTLTSYCYRYMFSGCTSLTQAPELPATTLAERCYVGMFSGCSSLTTAPDLLATTLTASCYSNMFDGCQILTQAPSILPATTLASYCYGQMFRGTRITTAPELPATTLDTGCYYGMFQNCYSLNSIKIGYTGDFSGTGVPTNAFFNWVNGVSLPGTFYYNGSDTTRGISAIPEVWTVQTF